jgi:site-specific DNA-methyltransferase (adenine-specific)
VGEDFHTPEQGRFPSNVLGEIAGHQKYFYCPKVTQRERMSFNTHPTVKPVELMKYLVRLVAPHTAHIVDPFCGSGSTGMACRELGRSFTGIELDPAYCEIARRRITATKTDPKNRLFE